MGGVRRRLTAAQPVPVQRAEGLLGARGVEVEVVVVVVVGGLFCVGLWLVRAGRQC